MFKTKVTEMLGIEYPIIQGGMAWVGRAELVAAVSNTGGLGIIGSITFDSAEELRKEIHKTRRMTDKPFGVNITAYPAARPIPNDEFVEVVLEEGVPVVETSGRRPDQYMERFKKGNVKVIHKVGAVRHALSAQRIGCDAVLALGFEAAGHTLMDDVTLFNLVPRMVDSLTIPVIAAGGMADARSFVAALALGAEGIMMGTRFIATRECPAPQSIKEALVEARETDTVIILRSLANQDRVLNGKVAERVLEMERRGASLEELLTVIGGGTSKTAITQGDLSIGTMDCGQGVGLIHDIPTVKEVIDGIMDGAMAIQERLAFL